MEEEKKNSMAIILPDDLVDEILKYLPERSLARFISVSKQWRSMINSTLKLLVVEKDSNARTFRLGTFSRDYDNNGQISRSSYSSCIILDNSIDESHPESIRVLGSCDGLVLITIYGFKYIYLINPKTMEQRTLSPTYLHMIEDLMILPFTAGGSHKVILMYKYNRIIFDDARIKVKVLNLNNGEQRDASEFPVYTNQFCNEQTSVFVNGSLFWLTRSLTQLPKPPKLFAMDLHTEKFRRVSLPNWYTKYSRGIRIWSLVDRLCLSDVLQCSDLDVWSLQQKYPSEKWVKIYSFNILNICRLNANFWTVGLAAAYFRRTSEGRPHLNQASLDHLRTIVYSPTLISPYRL